MSDEQPIRLARSATMGDMTEPAGPPGAYPGYATPTLVENYCEWLVTATPWGEYVGYVRSHGPVGCVASTPRGHEVGLFPDQQAAAEALVKHAGYEVLR